MLNAKVLKTLKCSQVASKIEYQDKGCKGLMLELRTSGNGTYYLRYRDTRGKQRQHRIADERDLTLEQARKRADELRGRIAMGEDPAAEKALLRTVPTFEEFVMQRYLPFVKVDKRSWNTDESLLRNHLLPRFGKRYLDEITNEDIMAMHQDRRNAGAAPGSANRLLILMRYIFNLALKWKVSGLSKNPTAGVKTYEENNQYERYLTEDEFRTLYDAIMQSPNLMLRNIIPMLALTGARKREVLDARWEDFDLEKRQWRIPMNKTGKPRYVPITDGAQKVLARTRAFLESHHLPTGGKNWAFPNPATGKPYVSFFIAWDTARKNAGLPNVRVHDLRHSFASFLINNGRSLYEVQRILGHTQVRTTQRYAHLQQETLVEAANAAVEALGASLFPVKTLSAPKAVALAH
jgi:integrase